MQKIGITHSQNSKAPIYLWDLDTGLGDMYKYKQDAYVPYGFDGAPGNITLILSDKVIASLKNGLLKKLIDSGEITISIEEPPIVDSFPALFHQTAYNFGSPTNYSTYVSGSITGSNFTSVSPYTTELFTSERKPFETYTVDSDTGITVGPQPIGATQRKAFTSTLTETSGKLFVISNGVKSDVFSFTATI